MTAPNFSRRPLSLPERRKVADRLDAHWRRVRLQEHYAWLASKGATLIFSPEHGSYGDAASLAVAVEETRTGQKPRWIENVLAAPKSSVLEMVTTNKGTLRVVPEFRGLRSLNCAGQNVSGFFNAGVWSNTRGYFIITRASGIGTGGAPLSNLYSSGSQNDHYPWTDYGSYLGAFSTSRRNSIQMYAPPSQWHALSVVHDGSSWKVSEALKERFRLLGSDSFTYSNPTQIARFARSADGLYQWDGEIALIVGFPLAAASAANVEEMVLKTLALYLPETTLKEKLLKYSPQQLFLADDGTYTDTSQLVHAVPQTNILRWKNQGLFGGSASAAASQVALRRDADLTDRVKVETVTGNTSFTHTYNKGGATDDYSLMIVLRPVVASIAAYRGLYSDNRMTMFSNVIGYSTWGTISGGVARPAETTLEQGQTYVLEMSGKHGGGGNFYVNGTYDGSYISSDAQGSHIGGFTGQVPYTRIAAILMLNRLVTSEERAAIVDLFRKEFGPLSSDPTGIYALDADGNRAIDADGNRVTLI